MLEMVHKLIATIFTDTRGKQTSTLLHETALHAGNFCYFAKKYLGSSNEVKDKHLKRDVASICAFRYV